MLRIGQVEATATQDGKYTDGSVAGGIAATRLRAAAFNAMQEELAHIVESAGLALDINDMTQVLKAIQKLTLSRANPFADIKSDGAAAISTALANLGLRTAAKADVVGTVSQSGGVPTGAIIERGSNSNGEYTKFADGTLICCFTKSVESITSNSSGGTTNLYFSTESVFTFPATFVGTRPVVAPSASLSTGGTSSWPSVRGSSLTGTSLALISNVQNAAAYLGYTAVGRWF
ncbi:gp53-like domain-containing protein [Citrobacter freundii]